jgi:hypothetical protein
MATVPLDGDRYMVAEAAFAEDTIRNGTAATMATDKILSMRFTLIQ